MSLVNELVEAGVHFGHRASRWNPKMRPYIYARRNLIHIIDVRETIRGLLRAKKYLADVAGRGSLILFVGTKRQASESIAREAARCGMPWISERWLGGTLTNYRTIRDRLGRLEQLEAIRNSDAIHSYSKKMQSTLGREYRKIYRNLNGMRTMTRLPECMVVVDPRKEKNAIKEARKLKIPIVAVVDTNCDPDGIDFPIPGNDDAGRAITLYCDLIARAAIDGLGRGQSSSGVDIGASEAPPEEELPEAVPAFVGIDAPRGEADDLKRISGISPKLEQSLNDAGVYHFWQIADLDANGVAALDAAVKGNGRVTRDNWVAQAKKFVDETAA